MKITDIDDQDFDDPTIKSIPKYYAQQALKRGQAYYNYQGEQQFNKLIWEDSSIYLCQKKIGRGKYSQVFQGINMTNSQKCVIKMLKPINQKKITRQVKLLMILSNHQNVIKLLDLVKQHEIYCLVFERVRSIDTKTVLRESNPTDVKYYLYQLLRGLHYCHSMGIMHRDIKPGNLLIDLDTKQLKILDWGLGEFYIPNRDFSSHVASRYYKPPELLVGYEYYHYSLDIWSFGAVLASAIFKIEPIFKGADNNDQLQQISRALGTEGLYNYIVKYNIFLEQEVQAALGAHKPIKFSQFVTQANKMFATPYAIDLIEKTLVYDHNLRPSALECMQHPYFDEVRSLFPQDSL